MVIFNSYVKLPEGKFINRMVEIIYACPVAGFSLPFDDRRNS